MDVKQSEVKG